MYAINVGIKDCLVGLTSLEYSDPIRFPNPFALGDNVRDAALVHTFNAAQNGLEPETLEVLNLQSHIPTSLGEQV